MPDSVPTGRRHVGGRRRSVEAKALARDVGSELPGGDLSPTSPLTALTARRHNTGGGHATRAHQAKLLRASILLDAAAGLDKNRGAENAHPMLTHRVPRRRAAGSPALSDGSEPVPPSTSQQLRQLQAQIRADMLHQEQKEVEQAQGQEPRQPSNLTIGQLHAQAAADVEVAPCVDGVVGDGVARVPAPSAPQPVVEPPRPATSMPAAADDTFPVAAPLKYGGAAAVPPPPVRVPPPPHVPTAVASSSADGVPVSFRLRSASTALAVPPPPTPLQPVQHRSFVSASFHRGAAHPAFRPTPSSPEGWKRRLATEARRDTVLRSLPRHSSVPVRSPASTSPTKEVRDLLQHLHDDLMKPPAAAAPLGAAAAVAAAAASAPLSPPPPPPLPPSATAPAVSVAQPAVESADPPMRMEPIDAPCTSSPLQDSDDDGGTPTAAPGLSLAKPGHGAGRSAPSVAVVSAEPTHGVLAPAPPRLAKLRHVHAPRGGVDRSLVPQPTPDVGQDRALSVATSWRDDHPNSASVATQLVAPPPRQQLRMQTPFGQSLQHLASAVAEFTNTVAGSDASNGSRCFVAAQCISAMLDTTARSVMDVARSPSPSPSPSPPASPPASPPRASTRDAATSPPRDVETNATVAATTHAAAQASLDAARARAVAGATQAQADRAAQQALEEAAAGAGAGAGAAVATVSIPAVAAPPAAAAAPNHPWSPPRHRLPASPDLRAAADAPLHPSGSWRGHPPAGRSTSPFSASLRRSLELVQDLQYLINTHPPDVPASTASPMQAMPPTPLTQTAMPSPMSDAPSATSSSASHDSAQMALQELANMRAMLFAPSIWSPPAAGTE